MSAKFSYSAFVKEAISTLKERGGSSLAAIKKFAAGKKVELKSHFLLASIKAAIKNGALVQVKGSYKLGEKAKKAKKPKVVKAKKPKATKPKAAKKAKAPKAPKAAKKTGAKKAAPKKTATKKAVAKKAAPKKA